MIDTFSSACRLRSSSQEVTCSNAMYHGQSPISSPQFTAQNVEDSQSRRVTSYTNSAPAAPLK